MEYRDDDTGLLHQKVGRFISINERFHPDSDFWNGPAGRTDRSPLSTFTSSVFLAAPPPSAAMRTHQQHCISPSSRSRSPETRSRSPETRSRSQEFESRLPPKQHSYSHSSHFISDLSSHDYPGRPLTSSFYMTTRPTSPERSTRVFPFKLTCNANSSSRVRYSSTGSAGSPSSTDSGTVSFDFSLPAQSSLVIDANNVSPRYQENTMEAIFSDSGNYSDCDTKTDGLMNPVTSVHHIDLNCNKSKVVVRKQINPLNRRASFEIHATNPELHVGAQIASNENRFSRRHSIHDDQSVALSEGRFSIDADINNNKYRDYGEEMLVDLLKKCTDFSERRRIRSALRYVRENNKESSCAKSERSTFFIPFREVAGGNNCAHVTTSTLKLSPREVKKEQITPVLTSTPREITLCSLEECAGEKTSVSSSFSDVDEHNSELRESSCLFDVQGVKLVKSYGHLILEESDEDKGVPHQSGKGEGRDRGEKTIPGTAKKTSGSRDTKKTSAPLTRPQRTQKSPSAKKGDGVTTSGSDTTAKQSPVVKTEQLQRKELPKAGTRQVVLQKAVLEKTDAKARPKSVVTRDSSATQGSFRSLQKETSTVPKRSVSSSAAGLVKKPSDEKRDSLRVTTSPRRKLPDVTLVVDQKQTTKTSPRSSSQTSTRAVSDKSKTLGKKSVSVLKPSENSKSGNDESDVFIVKTQAEKIVIPKIIISDETDDTECDIINKSSEESFENLSGTNTQKDNPKYYRKKERDSLPKKGGTVTEIKMSTASPVMTTAQKPVKMDLVNNNNGSSQSVGADLEKAFTDLLDNFDSIGENHTRVIEKQTDVQCDRDTLGENNNTIAKSSEINSQNLQERGARNEVKMESLEETECSEPQERLVSKDLTEEKAVDTEDENNRPLEATEDVFDMDRLGDVKVEESEDGSLTVTDVQEFNEGQRKVSVTTKKKRTDSEVEVQDKETTITTTFQSPSGTKYEEQDVIKTRRKLTPKGSIYIKRDAVKTKRAFSRTGEQTVEEDHVVETDNKSVSLGKSWGDKTMTTTVLSKPTKSERTIHAIQEEPHLDKTPTSEEGKQEENLELGTIPDILSILADQVVTVGSKVVLQCEGSGKPTPEVTWYAGDSVLTETAYFKLSFDGKTATLTITEAFPDDEKLYRCVFRNKHGSAETSGRLRVKVPNIEEVPSITTALEDIEATPKQRVTLSCRVTGLGEVFWHKEGTRLGDSPRHKLSLNSGWAELEISEVSLDDAGQYSCSVKNSAGEASTICQLLVSEEGCPPDILNPLFNCTAAEGKPFKLLCRISGHPPPSVRWLHDGRELLVSDNSKISYEDNIARLELKTVSPSDKGIYECIGTNSLGSASTNCELCVKEFVRPTKASIQLSLKSVSKSVDSNDGGDLTEGVRRLEASQSLDIPSSHSSSSSNAEDIYFVGTVRSCTPPPQQPISCSPPRNEIRTCSPPRSNISHISSNISSQNGSCSNTTPTQNTPQHLYGQSDSATKTSAVNRLQNFFGSIMNNNSSPAPCIRSPTEDVLVETKSSFVVRRQENGSQNKRGVSLDLSPNQVKDGGPSSGGELFGDLTNIHRDIIMSQKISEIEDDEVLHKMLNTTDNFDDRKAIRARLKELREKAREEWERAKKEREAAVVDVVKLKHQRAEQDKQRRMQNFQTRAETAGKDLEDKYLAQSQKDLQERQRFAADEKQKKLDAYKQIAKTGSGVSETRVSTSKSDSGVSETRVTTTSSTDVAHNIVNQLQNESSPYTSGKITVKTEAWDSRDGVVKKSETTQRWGANKPAGARGAMAAFKQMDSLNPTQAAKPNALVAVSLAKKAATTMRRNAVQIKAEILDFCKSNTSEYKEVNVTNFSSSWNNGMAFCALIHHFYPESFDFSKLDPKQRRKNFELAFDTAEKEADIAPLLDVEDMVKMKNPDWKCVFTYVQSFYRHLRNHPRCKQIAPVTQ